MAIVTAQRLAVNLINPNYNIATRRSQSAVHPRYINLLDSGFDPRYAMSTYPINSRGSLARIDSGSVEFFANTPKLHDQILVNESDKGLAVGLMEVERAGGLPAVRDLFVDALRLVGNRDYEVEWNHPSTRVRYTDLQNISLSYSDTNVAVAQSLKEGLLSALRSGRNDDVLILDAGVGNGGTTLPIISMLLDLKRHGAISEEQMSRVKFILFDVDGEKPNFLVRHIPSEIGFPGKGLIPAVGEFHSIADVLKGYLGKVSFFVSGAAICHVTNKELFFKALNSVMKEDGILSFWDPMQPLLFAPYVRCVNRNSNEYSRTIIVDEGKPEAKTFNLGRWERLPEEILAAQRAGRSVKVIGEIPAEAALRFAGVNSYLYLPQLGYTAENVGEGTAASLVKDAYSRILDEIFTERGHSFFNYISWLNRKSEGLNIRDEKRSPYQLIETVEDEQAYMTYLGRAGFSDINFRFFFPPLDYRTADTSSASSSVTGIITARKKSS